MPRCWSFIVYKQGSNLSASVQPLSPRKKSRKGLPCTQAINLFIVITFGDSTFTTDEINAYLLIPAVLAVSSDFSPSTESDQEAAIVSKVGCFVLVIKH